MSKSYFKHLDFTYISIQNFNTIYVPPFFGINTYLNLYLILMFKARKKIKLEPKDTFQVSIKSTLERDELEALIQVNLCMPK